jgi:glucose-6-phosphate 1-epimerase
MATEIEMLNASFAIGDLAKLVAGEGGLPKIQISNPAASAEIYLHGAQVTAWKPAGFEDVIFTSEHSRWEEGKAIRGGIPVCFPWFRGKADDPKAPAHGFVRTKSWALKSMTQEDGSICVTLATESDESTRRLWPHDFRIALRIGVGAQLKLELIVSNTGAAPFQFEEALHTYHRVGDARKASVAGLNDISFLDNRDGNRERLQHGDIVMVDATDNAYINTAASLGIADPVLQRRIRIDKRNSLTTVVWNPWESGAKALTDLGDDEWQQMLCVEACNIRGAAVTLAPGEEHRMAATIAVIQDGTEG